MLVLHVALASRMDTNATVTGYVADMWAASSSIALLHAHATPTFPSASAQEQAAIASFPNLTMISGIQGVYRFYVTPKGSDKVGLWSLIRLSL